MGKRSKAQLRFLAGLAREDITVHEPETCTFGWGDTSRFIDGVAGRLFARALVLEDVVTGKRVAYVVADLGMISTSLRARVVELVREARLGIGSDDVMLTATHTHSGPSGYSRYLFYASTAPGFFPHVHDALARGIADAIAGATRRLEPAKLRVHASALPLAVPIAWNRSLDAYNRNVDVEPLAPERADEAVDRTMTVLRVDAECGTPRGLVSWFGLHGTCIHSENTKLHGDHKGEAARIAEERARAAGHEGYVALFAQGPAGDVTPNHRFCETRGKMIGRYDSDFESAEFVGRVQADHAERVAEAALAREALVGSLDARLSWVDFARAPVDARFSGGLGAGRTASPRLGLGFAHGTLEGPGPLATSSAVTTTLARIRKDDEHAPKVPFLELDRGVRARWFGALRTPTAMLARIPNKFARHIARELDHDAEQPLVPRRLPAQLLRIGAFVIAGVPQEPTTVAGRRLAMSIAAAYPGARVVVSPYANAYAGYLTTPEEYALQRYEGASTLFGPRSLPAWCTTFHGLAEQAHADEANLDARRGRRALGIDESFSTDA